MVCVYSLNTFDKLGTTFLMVDFIFKDWLSFVHINSLKQQKNIEMNGIQKHVKGYHWFKQCIISFVISVESDD